MLQKEKIGVKSLQWSVKNHIDEKRQQIVGSQSLVTPDAAVENVQRLTKEVVLFQRTYCTPCLKFQQAGARLGLNSVELLQQCLT